MIKFNINNPQYKYVSQIKNKVKILFYYNSENI